MGWKVILMAIIFNLWLRGVELPLNGKPIILETRETIISLERITLFKEISAKPIY